MLGYFFRSQHDRRWDVQQIQHIWQINAHVERDEKLLENLDLTKSKQVKNAPHRDKIHSRITQKKSEVISDLLKHLVGSSKSWLRENVTCVVTQSSICGLMLCYCHIEILNTLLTRGPARLFSSGSCRLRSWSGTQFRKEFQDSEEQELVHTCYCL